jgi:hypothetical protein
LNARAAGLIVTLMLALAPAPAEASRRLSIATLEVPPSGQPGAPLEISGTVRNAGNDQARATVRAYLQDTFGQLRIGGRQLAVGPGRERKFSLSPALPTGVSDGDYEISVCARRLNRRGPTRCRSAPLKIEG